MGSWFQSAFEKLGELSVTVWIALFVLVVIGAGILIITRNKQKWTAKMLAFAALSIALSFVLSCVKIMHMPQGGSITAASMVPIMLFSYVFGVGPGLLTCVVYGILQCIQDAWIVNVWQFLLDYPFAFGVLGLAGLFRKQKMSWGLPAGIILGAACRYIAAVLSGVVFFAEYAGDVNPWIYSIGYNASYMLPEALITVVLGMLIAPRVLKTMKRA